MFNKEFKLIGYSGHSYGCIEIAYELGYIVKGYYDLNYNNYNLFNLEFLGNDNCLNKEYLFVSIGDNMLRKEIYLRHYRNNDFINLIHTSAFVSPSASIGFNVLVSANATINSFSIVENGGIINTGAIVEHECIIGEFSHVAPGAVLAGNVHVGALSFIGANAVIKQNVRIGNNVIVGAGTVVLCDVPDNSIIVGNPGKIR